MVKDTAWNDLILEIKLEKRVSFMSVLFPLPDTPVIAIKQLKGISISIFFKLLPDAPLISILFF